MFMIFVIECIFTDLCQLRFGVKTSEFHGNAVLNNNLKLGSARNCSKYGI